MRFLLHRFFITLLVLWGVCTITFFLLHLTPGDPVEIMLGENVSGADKAQFRHELGLDRPLSEQYFKYLKNISQMNLGVNFLTHRKVSDDLIAYLPATIELALASVFFAALTGIPLGIFSALRKGKWLDRLTSTFSVIAMSMPNFWLAPLLIIFLSIKLDLFPVSERDGFRSIVLPAVSLGLSLSAVFIRMTRVSFLEVLHQNYILVARSKGLSEFKIYFKHAFKNALTPIATVFGLQLGAVLTGVVITETIFDWPGIGILLYKSLQERNYPEVQGCVLLIAAIYVTVNFLTDLSYFVINPRLRDVT